MASAVRHATRAPAERPPAISGRPSKSAAIRSSTTAIHAASSCFAAAVLCLAFPLQPPARAGKEPSPSRQPELDAVKVPMLIVQGESDRFGMPEPGPDREVVQVRGDHSLRSDREAVTAAVEHWLGAITPKRGGGVAR